MRSYGYELEKFGWGQELCAWFKNKLWTLELRLDLNTYFSKVKTSWETWKEEAVKRDIKRSGKTKSYVNSKYWKLEQSSLATWKTKENESRKHMTYKEVWCLRISARRFKGHVWVFANNAWRRQVHSG